MEKGKEQSYAFSINKVSRFEFDLLLGSQSFGQNMTTLLAIVGVLFHIRKYVFEATAARRSSPGMGPMLLFGVTT